MIKGDFKEAARSNSNIYLTSRRDQRVFRTSQKGRPSFVCLSKKQLCAYNQQRDKVFAFVIRKRVREPDFCFPRRQCTCHWRMQVGEQAPVCLPKRQRASHPNLHNFPSTSHHTALRCRTNIRPVRQQDTKLPTEVLAKYCSENSHPFHLSQPSGQLAGPEENAKFFWSFQRCVTLKVQIRLLLWHQCFLLFHPNPQTVHQDLRLWTN